MLNHDNQCTKGLHAEKKTYLHKYTSWGIISVIEKLLNII